MDWKIGNFDLTFFFFLYSSVFGELEKSQAYICLFLKLHLMNQSLKQRGEWIEITNHSFMLSHY